MASVWNPRLNATRDYGYQEVTPALSLAHYQTTSAHHLLGGILAPGVMYPGSCHTAGWVCHFLRTRCSVIQLLRSLNTSLGISAVTRLEKEHQYHPIPLCLAFPCQLCLLNISNSNKYNFHIIPLSQKDSLGAWSTSYTSMLDCKFCKAFFRFLNSSLSD